MTNLGLNVLLSTFHFDTVRLTQGTHRLGRISPEISAEIKVLLFSLLPKTERVRHGLARPPSPFGEFVQAKAGDRYIATDYVETDQLLLPSSRCRQ